MLDSRTRNLDRTATTFANSATVPGTCLMATVRRHSQQSRRPLYEGAMINSTTLLWQFPIDRLICHVLAVIAALIFATGSFAEEPDKSWQHLIIKSYLPQSPFGESRQIGTDYDARVGVVEKDSDGQYVAYGVYMLQTYLQKKAKSLMFGEVNYPRLRKGDLVPVYNYVYEVTDVRDNGPGTYKQGSHQVEMKRLGPDKVPAGLALGRESLLFPLGARSGGRLWPFVGNTIVESYALKPTRIELPKGKAPDASGRPVAKLELEVLNSQAPPTSGVSLYTAAVEKGDALVIGGRAYKVRNVVPNDPKTRAIGWVELGPDPIPKADLVRDKVRVVEPVPVEDKPDTKVKQ
jgi:hypothetical protein